MPGQINIQNNSRSITVVISVESIDGKWYDLQDKKVSPTETVTVVVKGGVKKFTVYKEEGEVFWKGIIPAYGGSPVIIFPEKATVKYNGLPLVNMMHSDTSGVPQAKKYVYMSIAILVLAILIGAMYYVKHRK